MAPWAEHAMWWHVYPLGFAGVPVREEHRPPAPGGGLAALVPWLDHVVELGLNGLLLGPVWRVVNPLRLVPRPASGPSPPATTSRSQAIAPLVGTCRAHR